MQVATGGFDITARKVHQAICVALLVIAFLVGAAHGGWLVGFVGLVLLLGRFWWQADLFRQLAWRVLEPAGILKRREVQENHETRRIARALGGAIILGAAIGLAAGMSWAWIAVGLIAVMISLDALFNFCALCWLTYQIDKLATR
jgi:polyferredoxin